MLEGHTHTHTRTWKSAVITLMLSLLIQLGRDDMSKNFLSSIPGNRKLQKHLSRITVDSRDLRMHLMEFFVYVPIWNFFFVGLPEDFFWLPEASEKNGWILFITSGSCQLTSSVTELDFISKPTFSKPTLQLARSVWQDQKHM
jgi:hypothetical protein